MRSLYLQSVLLMIGVFIVPQSILGAVTIDRIIAVVDQEVITQSDLDRYLADKTNRSEKGISENRPSNADQFKPMIESKIIAQAARNAGIEVTTKQMEQALQEIERRNRFPNREAFRAALEAQSVSWEGYLADLKMEMISVALIRPEIESEMFITEDAARDYYQRHLESFDQGEQIELKQIVFPVQDHADMTQIERARAIAEGVRIEIQNGASFNQMAERYHQGTKGETGSLRLKKGEIMPEVEQIVFNMEIDAISPVVQTQIGFHIFKVTKKISGAPQSYEEAYPAISALLLQGKQETLARQWMGELLKRTFIEVK